MRIAVFSTRPHDLRFLPAAEGADAHELRFLETRLGPDTAELARDCDAVCAFVNDDLGAATVERLADLGVRLIALRSTGFEHVDLDAAAERGLTVVRVPAYSPHAIAEHATGLILSLNRKIHRAYNRVREGNMALHGLMGFDLHGRTVGVVGTGAIGECFARIMTGFGMTVLAFDPNESERCLELGVRYVPLEALLGESDVVSLHCPLVKDTYHLIDEAALGRMRDGVMLINTSRGGLVDTSAVIGALKSGRLGHLGLDVYEEEDGLFFEDRTDEVVQDDAFARLLSFPNVLVTGHQGFFTEDAMARIAATTIGNATAFGTGEAENVVEAR